jgi:hypothetical protein
LDGAEALRSRRRASMAQVGGAIREATWINRALERARESVGA